ncbi:MAG: hypothetical protein ACSHXZ_03165 [Gammaproteobacteria bacterium]
MIKVFVYCLLALVIGLLATLFLARDPGYLMIAIAGNTFETSLFALFVAIIALFILLRVSLLLLDWINPLRLFRAGRTWTQSQVDKRAHKISLSDLDLCQALHEDLRQELIKDKSEALSIAALHKMWKVRTKKTEKEASVIIAYVDVLEKNQAIVDAVAVLEAELEHRWDESLLLRYSLLSLRAGDSTAMAQLHKAEQWVPSRPVDAPLLMALGRLSLRNKLWGKARKYFERSLQAQGNPEVFAELARLLQSLKEPSRSALYLQKETRLVSKNLPDYPQPS